MFNFDMICLGAGEFPTRNTSLYLPCTVCAQRKKKAPESKPIARHCYTYIHIYL